MDDGNLNENVDQQAQLVDGQLSKERRMHNDDAHVNPSRWWFASSAFPMIAGTLGPVASAFSICALVRPWRQFLPTGVPVQAAIFIGDPPWLLAVNAVQLLVALTSNIFLLLNMARRVRFSIAQPVTIVGWYISAICLIALTASASGPLVVVPEDNPDGEFIWSQAFYYGMWAAILYFCIASLMIVTIYGAHTGHYPKDFVLTASQRTLMLQTILFLTYLLLGALVFSRVEGWTYLDAVYWANVTLFTVGFGDYAPQTPLGRALLIPYALIGVISLGLVIGSIRSLVLERGRRKVDARMVEKERRRLLDYMAKTGKDDVLEPIRSGAEIEEASEPSPPGEPTQEYARRRVEFELMRKIQHVAGVRRRWFAMGVSTGTWLVLWMVGAKIFEMAEFRYQQWTYFDGFYFTFVSLTTIGYGDFTPVSNCGKSFFVFWSLLALPTMTVLISNAGDTVVKFVRDATLRLGNVTILPGEAGFVQDVKFILRKLTFGKLFRENVEAFRPGSLGFAKPTEKSGHRAETGGSSDLESLPPLAQPGRNKSITGDEARRQETTNNPTSSRLDHTSRRSLSALRDPAVTLPAGAHLHYLLIHEITIVAQHMKSKLHSENKHHYSYEDWAWYLKLIGEDEQNPETHRKARPREAPHHQHGTEERKSAQRWRRRRPQRSTGNNSNNRVEVEEKEEEDEYKWSWVGKRSPLMGSIEESEWILERLMGKLKEELAIMSRGTKAAAPNFEGG